MKNILFMLLLISLAGCKEKEIKKLTNEEYTRKQEADVLSAKYTNKKHKLFLDFNSNMSISEFEIVSKKLIKEGSLFKINDTLCFPIVRVSGYNDKHNVKFAKLFTNFENDSLKNITLTIKTKYYKNGINDWKLSYYMDYFHVLSNKYGIPFNKYEYVSENLSHKESYWIKDGILISLYEYKSSGLNDSITDHCFLDIFFIDLLREKKMIREKRLNNQKIKLKNDKIEKRKLDSLKNIDAMINKSL